MIKIQYDDYASTSAYTSSIKFRCSLSMPLDTDFFFPPITFLMILWNILAYSSLLTLFIWTSDKPIVCYMVEIIFFEQGQRKFFFIMNPAKC